VLPHFADVTTPPADWLSDAVVYEIYPQSFADSDGDGIGDFPGALARLDHLAWLGVDTVWLNPCFVSPFRDAGYDVSDYDHVAPRYGTDADLVAFVDAARERGIRVLLDLVAGHTSSDHAWFRTSARDSSDDRYVWSERPGPGFVASPGPRAGFYLKNFYDSQPALNFGYARMDPAEPWRQAVDAPGPRANREALRRVMARWCDVGVAGFRVDMAFSLVKDDPGHVETTALWRKLHGWLGEAHPGAVLIPEGTEPVPVGTDRRAGFDADFWLVILAEHASLFDNGGAGTQSAHTPPAGGCYFDEAGHGSAQPFVDAWERHWAQWGSNRPVLLASSDHDFSRLACGTRTQQQLGAAFAFLLTWGTVPSIFAGDEIGVRYLPGLPDVEGSVWEPTYNRSGARTPVQWDTSANAGFSTAPADRLYLPVDPDPDRPDVAAQRADPDSVLHAVRRLITLRRATPALRARGTTEVLSTGYPLAYVRGGTHLVVVNPRREPGHLDLGARFAGGAGALEVHGVTLADGVIRADGFGYGVFALTGSRHGADRSTAPVGRAAVPDGHDEHE